MRECECGWNEIYTSRFTKRRACHEICTWFTKCSACHEVYTSRFTKRLACHEICTSRFTKCCACHEICTSRFIKHEICPNCNCWAIRPAKLDLLAEWVGVAVVECSSPSCEEVHRLHPVQTLHHLADLEKTHHHLLIDLHSPHLQNGLKNFYKADSLDSKNELLL